MKSAPVCLSALVLAACATVPVAQEQRTEAPPPPAAPPVVVPEAPAGRVVQNNELGFTVTLPATSPLVPGRDRGLIAAAPDGTTLRLYFEHLPTAATEDACWARLFSEIKGEMSQLPQSPEQLATMAKTGLTRGARKSYLQVYPRAESCLVLAVDGPKGSAVLTEAAPLALESFKVGQPSAQFSVRLAMEAGAQLLDRKEYAAALRQFEAALKGDDAAQVRAHFGAGLAAYLLGPDTAMQAIEHLSKVVAARTDPERSPEDELRQEQYRDALMYLGLAYASVKQYTHATSTLAELVERYPDDAIGRYNFACVLALSGSSDAALDELRAALKGDPELREHAKADDDLASLRELPAWRALLTDVPTQSSSEAR